MVGKRKFLKLSPDYNLNKYLYCNGKVLCFSV